MDTQTFLISCKTLRILFPPDSPWIRDNQIIWGNLGTSCEFLGFFVELESIPENSMERGGRVGALNRCYLSNWRFNPETVHFSSSKRPFLPTMFVSKCYKTKHFGQDSLFHKKPKLGRKNHYFYSVKMVERTKSLWKPRFGPQSLKT